MVYRKRTRRTRRTRRGGSKVMRMVRNLSRRVQGEVKKHVAQNLMTPTSYLSPITNVLNQILQGSAVNQRDGIAIKAKSILFRFGISHNSAVQTSTSRVIVYMDKRQIDATVPAVGQVLENDSDVRSPLNFSFAGRFKILYDKLFWTNALTKTQVESKFYKRISVPIRYADSTSTSLVKNGIYVIFMNDATPGGCATLNYNYLLSYYDN